MVLKIVFSWFFLSILFSPQWKFCSILIFFINYYGFSYKKIARTFDARIFESYLMMLARVFDAMIFANYCSGLLWRTNLNLGSERKSDEIRDNIRESETDWSPCTWLHSDCAIEANDAEKLTGVPIQKEVLPPGRNEFLESAVFWNRCTRLSN